MRVGHPDEKHGRGNLERVALFHFCGKSAEARTRESERWANDDQHAGQGTGAGAEERQIGGDTEECRREKKRSGSSWAELLASESEWDESTEDGGKTLAVVGGQ